MSAVEAGKAFQYGPHHFWGLSLSGIRTSIAMPDLSIAFDVAQGFPFLLNIKKFFISHGHLDHAAGIPYIISQKAMNQQPIPVFYMPESLIEPMTQIMRLWEKIEGHQYAFQFTGVQENDPIELNQSHLIKAFKTTHRIDSYGYTLFEKVKKLKPEFSQLAQNEIVSLKNKGIDIQNHFENPVVSFTGDTQIEFLDSAPWIKKSKILFLETTYLDERKSVEHARKWGHTHLDELIPRLKELECEKIVLIHISSRYGDHEIAKILSNKIPKEFHERVVVFPGR